MEDLSVFMPRSIMVVGVNTRPIVKSARALGMKTIAVDCFGDVDLMEVADVVYSSRSSDLKVRPQGPGRSSLLQLSLQALEVHEVDAVLLASGTEHEPAFTKELRKRTKVIGNDASHLETCKDKEKVFRIADRLGIPHPPTRRVRKLDDALRVAQDFGYPVVLKPAFGGGGIGIRLTRSQDELERFFGHVLEYGDKKSLYVQKYVHGINASTSVLSDGDRAECLTINEQIIGDRRLGVPRPFGYCGNVIPLNKSRFEGEIAEHSRAICEKIGLAGSNGVDFVLSDQPYLVEVNPRFQNTIDCVEGLLGINLVREHILACNGELGEYGRPKGCSVKLILYARKDVKIPDLRGIPGIVDIPPEGSIVRRGHPLCSILKFGEGRDRTVLDAYSLASRIQKLEES